MHFLNGLHITTVFIQVRRPVTRCCREYDTTPGFSWITAKPVLCIFRDAALTIFSMARRILLRCLGLSPSRYCAFSQGAILTWINIARIKSLRYILRFWCEKLGRYVWKIESDTNRELDFFDFMYHQVAPLDFVSDVRNFFCIYSRTIPYTKKTYERASIVQNMFESVYVSSPLQCLRRFFTSPTMFNVSIKCFSLKGGYENGYIN